jgi:hypothetical protein
MSLPDAPVARSGFFVTHFLEAPRDLNRVNRFLNLRVADIQACYKEWKAKGAHS